MKKTLKLMAALFVGAMFMGACQQAEEPAMEPGQNDAVVTRAYGDKTPKVTIYVETNDVNPLNAGDYVLPNGEPYADIVELFAANIHKRTVNGVTEPVLYLNDKMTNLMENDGYLTYIKPLQDKGIKVILTILGDHQGIGFTNLNDRRPRSSPRFWPMPLKNTGWTVSDSTMNIRKLLPRSRALTAILSRNCTLKCRRTN